MAPKRPFSELDWHLTPEQYPFTGSSEQSFRKAPLGKRMQGAVDARHRARRRIGHTSVPGNKADAVPCERYSTHIAL